MSTRARRFLFAAAVGVVAILPAIETARLAVALTLGTSTDPATLQRALALDPASAETEHRLGMVLFYSDSSPERGSALEHLRRATALAPREALYWSDLASVCETLGDARCAGGAAAQSLAASPMTPRLYWSTANYYLRDGRQSEALGTFRRLLELDPSYAGAVFRVCLQMLGTPGVVAQGILAANHNPHVSVAFVNLASSVGDLDSAYAEWRRLASAEYADQAYGSGTSGDPRSDPLSLAEVEPYLDRLIDSGREPEAMAVWSDLQRLGVVAEPDHAARGAAGPSAGTAPESQTVFNGGFEQNPLNAGFDWRYNPEPFVSVARSNVAYNGSHALRIEFTGDRNQEYEPVFEIVPVEPDRSYVLSAFVRGQSITSDTGPRLRVRGLDCAPGSCLDVSSAEVTSTTPWHAASLTFTTGTQAGFVRLSIWRPRSRGYPAEISGVFWVDDVSIVARALEASAQR